MKPDVLSANEQRLIRTRQILASFYFELYVRHLFKEILTGNIKRLPEFQQAAQYLCPAMRARLQSML